MRRALTSVVAGMLSLAWMGTSEVGVVAAADAIEVSTLVGSPTHPNLEDGTGLRANFDQPRQLAVAADGSILIADTGNHRIRVATRGGTAATLAGSGTPGGVDGPAGSAQLHTPHGVAAAPDGSVYFTDAGAHTVRRIVPSPSGTGHVVETVAGKAGESGFVNGDAAKARFKEPGALAVAPNGDVYVVDVRNAALRRIRNGVVSTVTGLRLPVGVAIGPGGGVFVADRGYYGVLAVSSTGKRSLYAGSGAAGFADGPRLAATFTSPSALAFRPDGTLVVTDASRIREIGIDGMVRTTAGSWLGMADGPSSTALFRAPQGVAVLADGSVAVADTGNHAIRLLESTASITSVSAGAYGLAVEGEWARGYAAWPTTKAPERLLVFAHGCCGWADYTAFVSHYARRFDAVAVVMRYRGAGRWDVEDGAEDTVAATADLLARFPTIHTTVLYGTSMGGEVSGLALAARPDLYDFWVNAFGVSNLMEEYAVQTTYADTDVTPLRPGNPTSSWIVDEAGGMPWEVPDRYIALSPAFQTHRMAGRLRRAYLLHAVADPIVSYSQTRELQDGMHRAGLTTSLFTMLGAHEPTQVPTADQTTNGDVEEVDGPVDLAGHNGPGALDRADLIIDGLLRGRVPDAGYGNLEHVIDAATLQSTTIEPRPLVPPAEVQPAV